MIKGIYVNSKLFCEVMGISEKNLSWFKIVDNEIIYREKFLESDNYIIKSITLNDFRDRYNKMNNNVSTKPTPKDGRVRNLKSENKRLIAKLNIANGTIKQQLDYQKELIDENFLLRASNKALEKMEENYNSQMEVAENEIKRLNQIIFYLETKCLKGFK